jgi:hypothetical protein
VSQHEGVASDDDTEFLFEDQEPATRARARDQSDRVLAAGALGWSIDADDMRALDGDALEGVRSLRSRIWQHG